MTETEAIVAGVAVTDRADATHDSTAPPYASFEDFVADYEHVVRLEFVQALGE